MLKYASYNKESLHTHTHTDTHTDTHTHIYPRTCTHTHTHTHTHMHTHTHTRTHACMHRVDLNTIILPNHNLLAKLYIVNKSMVLHLLLFSALFGINIT